MAADEKWYFTKEQLANTPSRKCGIDADKELSYRQQAANFIQDMGQRLSVTQLCINTAIVYMHRFYVFHSLSQFHRNAIATAALFLAAKVEEQPRKLEHVIKVAHVCLHKDQPPPDVRSEQYLEQAQDVVFNENVLLQTLGFDVAIDHPHTHVVRCCHLVKASKDLAQASYFMASNSLHMTTMCLQYKPTVVACFCIHLACKWSNWEIPQSNEGKHWFWYVDRSVTCELLQQLTAEFLHIFDNCPSRLKRRIKSISAKQSPSLNHPSLPNSPFDTEPRQVSPAADGGPTFQSSRPFPLEETKKSLGPGVATAASSSSTSSSTSAATSSRPPVDYREYREKKERERLEREKAAAAAAGASSSSVVNAAGLTSDVAPTKSSHHSHSHHGKQQTSQGTTSSSKHPIVPGSKLVSHHNHHGAHRNEIKAPQQTQRHSTSSSVQSSAGQTARPRIPRDCNATVGINSSYQHQTKDSTNLADGTGIIEIPTMSGNPDDNHGVAEKMSNHNRAIDGKHDKNAQQRGAYELSRHKILEHGAKEQEQKNYAKYQLEQQQQQQQQRGRKIVDSVEQRSEEVRKLIEKPLALPKALLRPEITSQKDDYPSSMMKQIHNPKYTQQQTMEKQSSSSAASLANMSRNPHDYGLAGAANREKATSGLSKSNPQLQQQHGNVPTSAIKKFDGKSNVKNGNSQLNAVADDSKSDKRSRHQFDDDRLQGNALINQQTPVMQQSVTAQPIKQHKSLFSPEKTTNQRETHGRISRSSRQKTPPSTGNVATSINTGITKSTKIHERVPDQSGNIDHVAFDNSQHHVNHQNALHHHHHHHHHQQQQHHSSQNPQESSGRSMSHKRHRTSSIGDNAKQQQQQQHSTKIEGQIKMESQIKNEPITKLEQSTRVDPTIKIEIDENRENYESMKMLGRVPELLQPIRDNATSTNGRTSGIHATSSLANDLKLPELIKPFEPEPIVRHASLTNGLDANILVKREDILRDSQDSGYSGSLLSRSSQDYLSPMKSAQSISALLQEPLAPMPSLLQGISDYGVQQTSLQTPQLQRDNAQTSSQRSYHYGDNQQQSANVSYQQSCQTTLEITSGVCEKDVLSTVDITALSAPQQTITESVPIATNHQTIIAPQRSSNDPQIVAQVATFNDEAIPTVTTIAGTTTTATATTTTTTATTNATTNAATSRKSAHHKSEKKKKKDKHKHKEKDKDKSKDKKKTKHKDKEKEKHIKITIPKDKLNLSTDNNAITTLTTQSQCGNTTILIGHEKKSPQTGATGLKIKIPKDRLKSGSDTTSQTLVQAPLKIKIRTTVGDNSESTISMSTSSSRKRDRAGMEMSSDTAIVAPPTKKQQPHHHSQGTTMTTMTTMSGTTTTTTTGGITIIANQQHPTSYNVQGQRQNGRHYSSNNKEKHTSSSHHKNSNKLSQQQQQQLLLQQQQLQQHQQQQQQQHHQHSHPT